MRNRCRGADRLQLATELGDLLVELFRLRSAAEHGVDPIRDPCRPGWLSDLYKVDMTRIANVELPALEPAATVPLRPKTRLLEGLEARNDHENE